MGGATMKVLNKYSTECLSVFAERLQTALVLLLCGQLISLAPSSLRQELLLLPATHGLPPTARLHKTCHMMCLLCPIFSSLLRSINIHIHQLLFYGNLLMFLHLPRTSLKLGCRGLDICPLGPEGFSAVLFHLGCHVTVSYATQVLPHVSVSGLPVTLGHWVEYEG